MTTAVRILARIVSWALFPLVAIVLGWRWAWDRIVPASIEVVGDIAHAKAVVRYSSGREEAYVRLRVSEWSDAPRYISHLCEIALVRAEQARDSEREASEEKRLSAENDRLYRETISLREDLRKAHRERQEANRELQQIRSMNQIQAEREAQQRVVRGL